MEGDIFMKKRKYIGTLIIVTIMTALIICTYSQRKGFINQAELEKIELNHVAVSASDYNIDQVHIDNSIKKEILDYVPVYKVNTKKYSDKDIKMIVKKGMDCKIANEDEDGSVKTFELSNGGNITYYKNSGTISYGLYNEKNEKMSKDVISNSVLKKKAQLFIEKIGLYSMDELEFYRANPSITVQTSTDEKIIEYEVVYTKKTPEGIDGFDGTGPGIIVKIDCDGNVTGFVSIDKDIEVISKKYPTKNIQEIEKDIANNNNVMIYSNKDVKSEIDLKKLEYVLYSDSVNEEQEYMVPHYRLKGKKQDDINIVLPAVDNSYITIKQR